MKTSQTDLFRPILAGVVVMLVFGPTADAWGIEQVKAVYVRHPEDREPEQTNIPPVANELSKAFLTAKLVIKREPVDLFVVPGVEHKAFPKQAVGPLLAAYCQRREWPEGIQLGVRSTLLDLTRPNRKITTTQQLKNAVKNNAEFPTYNNFCHLVMGENTDDPAEMSKSVLKAFFSGDCRQTLVWEVGDGDQLHGFLLATLREEDNRKMLVGLLVVWD